MSALLDLLVKTWRTLAPAPPLQARTARAASCGSSSVFSSRRLPDRNRNRACRRKVRADMGRRTLPPVVINEELWRRILEVTPGDSVVGSRNRALLHVLYCAGLRISEALALRGDDVDLDSSTVRVRRGKGGKYRIAALLDPAGDELRPLLARCGRGLVFTSSTGEPLRDSYVRAWLKRTAHKLGVERLHAHGARHGHTLHLVEKNVALHMIRDQLGHSSIATTDKYIARIAPTKRVEAILGACR